MLLIALGCAYLHYLYLASKGLWWGGNICSGLFFYICGQIFVKRQYEREYVLLSIMTLAMIAFLKPTIVTMFGNFQIGNQEGLYLLWYPYCLSAIIVFNNLVRKIPKTMLKGQILTMIGRNSMYFYLFHYSVAISISMLYRSWVNDYNGWECFCYMCLYGLGFMPLFLSVFKNGTFHVS